MILKGTNRIILFGGNRALLSFALNAKNNHIETIIFTDEYRLDSLINEKGTLRDNFEHEGIPYIETDTLSKSIVAKYVDKSTIGLSICTFWIFKRDIIELFSGRLLNYHGARLPAERGAGAYTWKILSQSRIGGLTIHKVEEGLDTGDIVICREFCFPTTCRIPIDFMNHNEHVEKELFDEFIAAVIEGKEIKTIPQLHGYSRYWPLLNTPLNGYINWEWSFRDIELFINAFDDPNKGASTFCGNIRVHFKKCFSDASDGEFHPFQAGIIYRISREGVFVAAKGGCLFVKDIFDEDGNRINNKIKIGSRVYTPYSYLENAKMAKIIYNSKGLKTE